MKKFFFPLLLIFSAQVLAELSSPRETIERFVKSMVKIKKSEGVEKENYYVAISALDLTDVDATIKYEVGKKYSIQLMNVIDKIQKVNYETIPVSLQGKEWTYIKKEIAGTKVIIHLSKVNEDWLFSKKTLNNLDEYEVLLKDKNVVKGVETLMTPGMKLKASLPQAFAKKSFLIYNWQWVGLLIIIFFSFIIQKTFDFVLTLSLNKYFKFMQKETREKVLPAVKPLGVIVFFALTHQLIPLLEVDVKFITYSHRILVILMSIYAVKLGHRVIELLTSYATEKAAETETKFDDILIPLFSKTAYVIIYILGGILIANSLTINVSGIIAGLGIGGLAFAFAAKDTLANFFGSIMLVLDRPFDIGDVIKAGDLEGVVSEVGFRSTRIRTFNDSVISVSNGALMNMAIENLGKRRYRRLVTTLGLEYDTPAEKIEAFCEGIRELILNHKWTRKDSFHVYFVNFGASSLDIQLVCYWETADYARELAEKHRLMIDILRLAKEVDVSFAFPTQTVHMFNQELVPKENIEGEFRAKGREVAKTVAAKPITLKNPRSNGEDREQFGENEV